MRVFLAVLVALTVASVPIIWQIATQQAQTEPEDTLPEPVLAAAAPAPQDGLGAELDRMRADILRLQRRVDALEAARTAALASAPATLTPEAPQSNATPDRLRNAFAQVVLIGERRSSNEGLSVASPRFLKDMFGLPRSDLSQECQPATNAKLKGLLVTEDVGPIRVRLVKPAVASIRRVFAEVEQFEPELYARIKSSGSLCVRFIRGSTTSASAHAYGLAVDINIDGQLDNFADGRTQLGLILLADFFKKEGWIWGAGFRREDSMHFEVSREKLQEWREKGLI